MSNPPQPNPRSAGDERPGAGADERPVSPGFEEKLAEFWTRHRGWILGVCVAILLVIVGRFGWGLLQERRAAATAAAYAAAETDEQLKSFAAGHEGAALAGVAQLQLADRAYSAGRYSEARAAYEQARQTLDGTPFAARASLGAAMARLKAGETDAGKAGLRQVANDLAAPTALRAEAVYHLASLAAAAGETAEVTKLVEQVNAIEPTGMWAQRATMLRETAAPAAENTDAASAEDRPTISFPASTP